jgi:phytoene synthase
MRSSGNWCATEPPLDPVPVGGAGMSVQACADLVRRSDPERFRAAMAAPVTERAVLLVLYAFNLEVVKAPWVTQEPMIAEMRLQWWRDVIEEIAAGKPARAHEVAGPLAGIVTPRMALVLDRMIAARRWDIYKDPFEDGAHFDAYLRETAGGLVWSAMLALKADDAAEEAAMSWGAAAGLARYLVVLPELEARGRVPLLDGRPEAIADLARKGLSALCDGRAALRNAPRAALIEGWMAEPTLGVIARRPECLFEGGPQFSALRVNWRLLRCGFGGVV